MRTTTTSVTKTCTSCGAVNKVVILTAGVPPRWRVGCSACGHTIVGVDGPTPAERAAEVISLPVPAMRVPATAPVAVESPGAAPVVGFRPLRPVGRRRDLRPVGYGWDSGRGPSPAVQARRRREAGQDLAHRMWVIRASARVSTGVSLVAICAIALTAFMLNGRAPTGLAADFPGGLSASLSRGLQDSVPAGTSAPGARALPGGQLAALERNDAARLAAIGSHAQGAGGAPAPVYTHPRLPHEGRVARAGIPPAATAAAGDPGIASIVDLQRPLPAVYPDPREGEAIEMLARRHDVTLAATGEEALDLTRDTRREVQRRLQLASHDPRSIDGIFGPMTRSAITEWQGRAGLPATGYLDAAAMAALVDETQAEYRAWRTAQAARRDTRQVASASPTPRPNGSETANCARQRSGEVAYGRSVRCDFRGLRESIGSLRENIAGVFVKSDASWPRERRRPGGA